MSNGYDIQLSPDQEPQQKTQIHQLALPRIQDGHSKGAGFGHLVLTAEDRLGWLLPQEPSGGRHFGNNTGGPQIWLDRFTGAVRSRYEIVTIAMPNNEAGRRGAEIRAEALYRAGCSVKVLYWENRPEGHCVADEIEKYGVDSLLAVLAKAEPHDLISLNQIKPEEVAWLWEGFIPLGKLTGLQGDPDVGKTFLMCEIAAKVSRGELLYGEVKKRIPGPVLIVSEEDGLADTIIPRLLAAGADLEKIKAPKVHLDLASDEGRKNIERWISRLRPRIVFVDTVDNHTGGKTNPNMSNEVREITRPLCGLAEKYACAIVLVRHMGKDLSGGPLHRGAGSMAWTGACRVVLYAGMKSESERALFQIKNNLAPKVDPVGYRIEDSKLIWTGPTSLQPHEVGAGASLLESPIEEAEEFLRETLGAGALAQEEIAEAARAAGHSEKTLRRAKTRLNIRSYKRGARWIWALPMPQDGQPSQPKLATLEGPDAELDSQRCTSGEGL